MKKIDIQAFRVDNKMTQQQLAKRTGYPQGYISKMERGIVPTPVAFVGRLIEEFGENALAHYTEDVPDKKKEPARNHKEGADQLTIRRLLDIIEKRDARIEKLEAEIDMLRAQLDAKK